MIVTLEPAAPDVTRGAIGIRFIIDDAEAAPAELQTAGVDTDEILRWPGVPAMFAFRDPDVNAFSITGPHPHRRRVGLGAGRPAGSLQRRRGEGGCDQVRGLGDVRTQIVPGHTVSGSG